MDTRNRTPTPSGLSIMAHSNPTSRGTSLENRSTPPQVQCADPQTPCPTQTTLDWRGLLTPATPTFKVEDPVLRSLETSPGLFADRCGDASALEQTTPTDSEFSDANELSVESPETSTFESLENTTDHSGELIEEEFFSPIALRRGRRACAGRASVPPRSSVAPRSSEAPPTKPKQDSKPVIEERLAIAPEAEEYSRESTPVPFHGIPTAQSLDWQLQYPPGGSTHASYPYPSADPRLVFRLSFVPVVNGLPDVYKVPNLPLPIGWRHVSWAGLLPIAFDPYQQAFKLTPIGPMPLTCEEVHQMGLDKYVPGGKFHPESGLLPEMMNLSDGSDGEVYNWDGVDHELLPWAAHTTFIDSAQVHGISTSPVTAPAYVPREARDCPDKVFELSDAWRWIAGRVATPDADWVPDPKKKWSQFFSQRLRRKFKAPIPELMMAAILANRSAGTPDPSPILQNQDAPRVQERSTNLFCPFKSVATPMFVDITLLEDTEFTLKELLCYFPQHYSWANAAERLNRAGIRGTALRDIIALTRCLNGETLPTPATLSGNMLAARRLLQPVIKEEGPTSECEQQQANITTNYTSEGWTYPYEKTDYPLFALAHGLVALPEGKDAGPLTALMKWAKEQERYQILISEVPALLKEAGIPAFIELSDDGCPDKEFLPRHAGEMKKDRKRLLDSSESGKRSKKLKKSG
ncbi:hypothetical protein IQ07DRAFT_633943 [Pyrenochaeta sp. DS3sAY3a]|nr:hypothetical protein IQ07DRAFT_633943 [Pyrenochaeta sp. DS3sAY3a]